MPTLDIPPHVRAKIAYRIASHLEDTPTTTVSEATKTAAWEALVEVRAAGWCLGSQEALVFAFAEIGAEIGAEAQRQVFGQVVTADV